MDNQRNQIKHVEPIEKIIGFCKALQEMQYAPFAINYSVRGMFVSIYLPVDPMIHMINYLASQNMIDTDLKRWYVEKGYSPTDVYFKRFGYDIRIAMYKEKHENNHDLGWLHADYENKIFALRQELAASVNLMEYHKVQAETMRQAAVKPKKKKK